MKYKVKTFDDVKKLEEYLNEHDVNFDDIKIVMNHNLILLVVRMQNEGGAA